MNAEEARRASNEAPFLKLMEDIGKASASGYRNALARLEHMSGSEESAFIRRVEELGYTVSAETVNHGYDRLITWVEVSW